MAKKISKKTFTIFVVLAILVLVGFLFYSFNKKSNLFEGQTTNPNPPAGNDEGIFSALKEPIDEIIALYGADNVTKSTNQELNKLSISFVDDLKNFSKTLVTMDDRMKKIDALEAEMPEIKTNSAIPPGMNPVLAAKLLADGKSLQVGGEGIQQIRGGVFDKCPDGMEKQMACVRGFICCKKK